MSYIYICYIYIYIRYMCACVYVYKPVSLYLCNNEILDIIISFTIYVTAHA